MKEHITKDHILIVEDEALLYERMRRILLKENYSIDMYTPSVDEALQRINAKRPDLVLLDINLNGEKTGLDLGKLLSEKFDIPFIYVTSLDDDETFKKGLDTKHENFIVKTKPRLNAKDIIRAIQTILNKNESRRNVQNREGFLALTDFLSNIQDKGMRSVSKAPIKFENIVFISKDMYLDKTREKRRLPNNYLWLQTDMDDKIFFVQGTLRNTLKQLPSNFIRISNSFIVNLTHKNFKGYVSKERLLVSEQILNIGRAYSSEVRKQMKIFYN